jgi:hypothetical protein
LGDRRRRLRGADIGQGCGGHFAFLVGRRAQGTDAVARTSEPRPSN